MSSLCTLRQEAGFLKKLWFRFVFLVLIRNAQIRSRLITVALHSRIGLQLPLAMNSLLVLLCFMYGSFAIQYGIDIAYDDLWKSYKIKFNKNYSVKYEGARRLIFEQNARMIAKHNVEADFGLFSYRLELNKFSDMTGSELDVYRKCLSHESKPISPAADYYECDKKCLYSLPISVDWRTKNFVTPIKDQGDCGSCWAFSATGALEGQNKAKEGYLVSLSEQNLVDCSRKQGNNGCDGGWMEYAFKYVVVNKGIDTEQAYPYIARDDFCHFDRSEVGGNCTKYVYIKTGSEIDLQAAVANIGPISVAIDADGDKFMSYKHGIYYDNTCTTTELDHAVLVVGYGTKNGSDYWIVKNSWGSDWGMDGYILMARNHHNQCGIATHAVYPVV